MNSALDQAIRNNMTWCQTVLSAHGIGSEIREHHWTTNGITPPFYGNLVTCTHDDAAQLARVEELLAAPPRPDWGMKDSFARLEPSELERLGMRVLFEARWFSGRCAPRDDAVQIQTAEALERWERAWQVTSPAPGQRVFPAALLADEDVTFMAAMDGDTIVGGAIANVSGGVVGLSNEFGRSCAAAVQLLHPDRPIVGYGRTVPVGMDDLGPLRVWVKCA